MTMTLRIAILCAVLAAGGSPRSAPTAPESKGEIEKLGMFLGRWDTTQGNVWTYWDEADEAGKHIQFRTTNTFQSPATVVWRSEYSEDGAHWILMGEGTDTRKK